MSYFMAADDLVKIELECGRTVTVIRNLAGGKVMELRDAAKGKGDSELTWSLLEFCIKEWDFTAEDGTAVPLSRENIVVLNFKILMDLLKKVMVQYDFPFEIALETSTMPTGPSSTQG